MYIGQSVCIPRRLRDHRIGKSSSNRSALGNAVLKYGWEAFDAKVVLYATDREYLNLMEERLIQAFNSRRPNGFNIRIGGDATPIAEESKQLISKIRKAKFASGELVHHRPNAGKKMSLETRAKMSAAHKGVDRGEAFKLKMRQLALERWQNPVYRDKVLAAKGIL